MRISPFDVQHELNNLNIFQEDELQTFYGEVLEVNQCTNIEEVSREALKNKASRIQYNTASGTLG